MFPHYIETTTFGISCDAYANLKETLTRHKAMVAEYLDKNYERVSSPLAYVSRALSKLIPSSFLVLPNVHDTDRHVSSTTQRRRAGR